ncbi:hypothetical protein [Actinoplanes sp. N902-109]|uniref:hypothetical protein n=1 Tax=Actinoplanes sp. (strain N902-109) TaxID=649831 RepID=UPI000329404D|nr:hypothetical protein [Actinoplanes sp. N902-109]AGL19839.1 hypothetical protein L083_6329 [Actinoplanes sp. N902-109]
MTEHADQLREAFRAHEDQTPDPALVYARVRELARTYQRRRRGYQAAGGAVLGAGLIAGAFQLPGLLPASQDSSTITMVAPAAAPSPATASPSAAPSPTAPTSALDKQYDAYFAAGYDYDDALKLAKYWKLPNDRIDQVKAKAGKLLLQHKPLPDISGIKPDPVHEQTTTEEKRVNAFFGAGYDYDDAVELSKLWKTKTPYDAKVLGGKKLLAGAELPIKP